MLRPMKLHEMDNQVLYRITFRKNAQNIIDYYNITSFDALKNAEKDNIDADSVIIQYIQYDD